MKTVSRPRASLLVGLLRRQDAAEPRGLAVGQQRAPAVPACRGVGQAGRPAASGAQTGTSVSRPTANALKSVGLEARRRIRVMVAEQEVDLPAEHDLLAGLHAVGDQVERAERFEADMLPDPAGKEGERERMRRRDRQRRRRALADRLRLAARPLQACAISSSASGRRWAPAGVRVAPCALAHEERSADPLLEGADAPAEGRLRHVTGIRRAREVALVRQRQKILEPVQIHGDAARACGDPIMALANPQRPGVNGPRLTFLGDAPCASSTFARSPSRSPRRSATPISTSPR